MFGISDGLVSNVSLVLGFAGSGVDASVVRLAGVAGAIAGAASMAAGEWVSVSANNELIERELRVERRELDHNPAAEERELSGMYERHGMSRQQAESAAAEVMQEPEVALVVHAREELGVDPGSLASPWQAAAMSLLCFLVGAFAPVVPWFGGSGTAAKVASVAIGIGAAGIIGASIGRLAERPIARSAARQVLILLLACGATYLVGSLLHVTAT